MIPLENSQEMVIQTYSQDWPAYNKAQTQEGHFFMKLLAELCAGTENKAYVFGRPKLPMSDMVFASALKVYSTFSLRRFVSLMQSAKEKGHIAKVSHYSTVARYMENEEFTPILIELIKQSSMALSSVEKDFAIDSSGFSTCRFKRWYDHKYGREIDKRVWIKLSIACGVKTNVITAVQVSEEHTRNDSVFFKDLVNDTAKNFQISEVSADKAYCGRENMETVGRLGAIPFIPFKKDSRARAGHCATWHKMFYYFKLHEEEFMRHYHKRSNVETTFHMVKSKFGDSLRSKKKTAQINEVLLKVLCHNICVVIQEMFELGLNMYSL